VANQIVQTDGAPAAIGPYSQAVVSGSMIFVSGQLGLNPQTGEMAGEDFRSQAVCALENLQQVITAGGFSLNDVVAVDVFLTDLGQFGVFNKIYAGFFSDHRPARAVVEVSALPKNALIEIKCMAKK
jgi:2-iminobutanoate/2-iminopropanoate deaminase